MSLAIALLGRPDLLVLDEPTVGLDPVLRRDLWELFHRLSRSGVSLLVSSHVMDEAARCDRLILLRGGAVLADGALDDLLARTGDDRRRGRVPGARRRGRRSRGCARAAARAPSAGSAATGRRSLATAPGEDGR